MARVFTLAGKQLTNFEKDKLAYQDIQRTPFSGIGKPEPLKHSLQGCWSRRIDSEHRLVYEVSDNMIKIIGCRFHY